jgi:hypothetical protein
MISLIVNTGSVKTVLGICFQYLLFNFENFLTEITKLSKK